MLVIFILSGIIIVLWGDLMLNLLKSSTMLLPTGLLILVFVQHYLEYNHSNAAQYLLSRNEVPDFILCVKTSPWLYRNWHSSVLKREN